MKNLLRILVIATVALVAIQPAAARSKAGFPRSMEERAAQAKDAARADAVGPAQPSIVECTVRARGAPNVNLDCDSILPNNEPDIEVDPKDPQHMIGSSNDYDQCCDAFYTTFDGGKTWLNGNMSALPDATGSDPVTVFDVKHKVAIHSSLNFFFDDEGDAGNGHVVVSRSTDGGVKWKPPVIVEEGVGFDGDEFEIFNDKEWIVTDNSPRSPFYGRTYLTWSRFELSFNEYLASPIWESHSDDGGKTWSEPHEISGSNATYCTFQVDGPAGECDENQFSVPTVGPDGTVYVAFQNEQHEAAWEPREEIENQYMVVKSTNGGASWSAPVHVVDLEDGTRDYPINVNGRQTLTEMQVRVNSAGNIDADPRTGLLYLVFADNRAGVHDVAEPITNTNVYMMTSFDGVNWAGPTAVDTSRGDQWFPWVDVDPVTGKVGVLYHDRVARFSGRYETALSEGFPGSFTKTIVTTAQSNPNKSVFFQAGVPGCNVCATFHGDYNNIDYGPDGTAQLTWTDMRDPFENLFLQFIYYANQP